MIEDVRLFLEPQIGFLAKSSGEQLWAHHFTVYRVCMRLLELLPAFPEELVVPLQLACLTHDIGKMRPEAQQVLAGGGEGARVVHKLRYEEVRDYIESAAGLASRPTEKQLKAAYDMAVTHHSISDEDIIRNSTAYAGSGVLLLRVSDWLASMEQVDVETTERITSMFTLPGASEPLLHLTYFEIGREPGPSTSLIAWKTLEAFEERGYRRLVLFPNAGVVAKCGAPAYPDRASIAQEAYQQVAKGTLSNIKPSYGPGVLLIGICAEFPDEYLVAHQDEIKGALAGTGPRAAAFFKLLSELMKLLSFGPSSRKNTWQMNVVHGVVIGRSAVKKPAAEWLQKTGEELPKKQDGTVDRGQALGMLMSSLKLTDLLNDPLLNDPLQEHILKRGLTFEERLMEAQLSSLKADELYDFLLALATLARSAGTTDEKRVQRVQEIAAMISFPEEEDYRELAAQRLQAYKQYKKSPAPDRGICEMCGSAFTQKLGEEAPEGSIQCFSYIKSDPTLPRAACYLCAFDLSLVRKDVTGSGVSVTLWITSKVELELEDRVLDMIKRAEASFLNPRYLASMVSPRKDLGLPLPEGLKLPLSKKALEPESTTGEEAYFFRTPFGSFLRLRRFRKKDFSIKNQHALYAPLYDLLNMLGFNSCITNDLEFRYGLFGENRISSIQSYHDAISVLLLAKTFPGEKRNPHCIAANIIGAQPSVAIAKATEPSRKTKKEGLLLTQEQLAFFMKALMKANRPVVKGGLITMGELLHEAAFFARNIPVYCVEPEDRKEFWGNLTKHKATKAILAPLNEMMRGRDLDVAKSKFLSQLSVKVGKEEREGLDDFVKGSSEILEKYFELRQSSFSDFLKAKNALMNAIFAFTRYKDLEKVLNA